MFFLSTNSSWTCGVFLAGDSWQSEPTENYFVFPQQMKTTCPVSSQQERNTISSVCKRLGKKWSEKWSATAVGRSGREGDTICKIVADRLNITEFPSQVFPQGIMVWGWRDKSEQHWYNIFQLGYFYNFCGKSEWKDTGARKSGGNLCCRVKILIRSCLQLFIIF